MSALRAFRTPTPKSKKEGDHCDDLRLDRIRLTALTAFRMYFHAIGKYHAPKPKSHDDTHGSFDSETTHGPTQNTTTVTPIQFLNRRCPAAASVWHTPNDIADASWQDLDPWKWRINNTDQLSLGTPTYPDPGSTDTTLNHVAHALSQSGHQQAKNTPHKIQPRGTQITVPAPNNVQRSITYTGTRHHPDPRVRLQQHATNYDHADFNTPDSLEQNTPITNHICPDQATSRHMVHRHSDTGTGNKNIIIPTGNQSRSRPAVPMCVTETIRLDSHGNTQDDQKIVDIETEIGKTEQQITELHGDWHNSDKGICAEMMSSPIYTPNAVSHTFPAKSHSLSPIHNTDDTLISNRQRAHNPRDLRQRRGR
jgi:hypothetical protein